MAFAQYDVDLANQLLDEMGLDKRDADDFRLRLDSWGINMYHPEAFFYEGGVRA